MSKLARLSFLCFLLSFAALPVLGQSNYASLSGTVFDPQRQAIPGATVQITSVNTQAARQVQSNDQGAFQFTGLLPGEYKLSVQAQGFALLTQTVNLEVGQQMTLDVDLPLASISGNVEITSQEAVLRTTDEIGRAHV